MLRRSRGCHITDKPGQGQDINPLKCLSRDDQFDLHCSSHEGFRSHIYMVRSRKLKINDLDNINPASINLLEI